MANISNIIEQFILEHLGEEDSVELARNDLAAYFACAPSQINYVLTTRFTVDRGFYIESRRGGGGSITVVRIASDRTSLLDALIREGLNSGLSFNRACQLVDNFVARSIIKPSEGAIIRSALSDKALSVPIAQKDYLRASILKNIILELSK